MLKTCTDVTSSNSCSNNNNNNGITNSDIKSGSRINGHMNDGKTNNYENNTLNNNNNNKEDSRLFQPKNKKARILEKITFEDLASNDNVVKDTVKLNLTKVSGVF